MEGRGWGRLITIASTAGLKGYSYVSAYTAAKHGAVGLTRAVAQEVAGTGITANALCPGYLNTEMTERTIANIVEIDRPEPCRRAEGAHSRQPAGPPDRAGRGDGRRAVAVRARVRGDQRAGDRDRRR